MWNPGTLVEPVPRFAQASGPFPSFGFEPKLRVRGLGDTLVGRFKWNDYQWDSATSHTKSSTHIANYVYRASAHELERRTCVTDTAGATTTRVIGLATKVASAPTVTCVPAACPTIPDTISINVVEIADPLLVAPVAAQRDPPVPADVELAADVPARRAPGVFVAPLVVGRAQQVELDRARGLGRARALDRERPAVRSDRNRPALSAGGK